MAENEEVSLATDQGDQEEAFDQRCRSLRNDIKRIGDRVINLHNHSAISDEIGVGAKGKISLRNLGEMQSNITLAYRHLEDAAMRLGKAIQAYDGGVSVYDK